MLLLATAPGDAGPDPVAKEPECPEEVLAADRNDEARPLTPPGPALEGDDVFEVMYACFGIWLYCCRSWYYPLIMRVRESGRDVMMLLG